jgi:hypothetical protein
MKWLALALILTACTPVKLQPVSHDCPWPVSYTAAEQTQAADELAAIKSQAPMVARMITDYGRERATLRACHQAGDLG